MNLNLGCKKDIFPNSINVDIEFNKTIDIQADALHLPFKNNLFDNVFLYHIVEHLRDMHIFLKEIYRVSKTSCILHIRTPFFAWMDSWTDIQHFYHFCANTFVHLCNNDERFKLLELKLNFNKSIISKIGNFIAKRNIEFYEKHLSYIFPAREIEVKIKVVK